MLSKIAAMSSACEQDGVRNTLGDPVFCARIAEHREVKAPSPLSFPEAIA